MSDEIARQQAMVLFERAYKHQMNGELGYAIAEYKRSIALFPTAEAYTFLGWTYSMLNRYELAIEVCRKAIEIDPEFGNPYNDIGAYLIDLGRYEESLEWLEKAMTAPRYRARHFPHMNRGRALERLGRYRSALVCYNQAIDIEPLYQAAIWARNILLGKLN